MRKVIILLAFIPILFINCTSEEEKQRNAKEDLYNKINQKYVDLGFIGVSEIYKNTKIISVYSKVFNEKRNRFDLSDAEKTNDSLLNIYLKSYNITVEEFRNDMDSINYAKNYTPNYLDHYYNKLYDDNNLKMGFYKAFKNNPNIDFETASKEYSHFHFKKGQSQQTTNSYLIDKESVEKWMSNYDGSIFEFEYEIKKKLHDPSTYEHVETSYLIDNGVAKVRMKFRAKNKIGALVLNQADGILDISNGKVNNITVNH